MDTAGANTTDASERATDDGLNNILHLLAELLELLLHRHGAVRDGGIVRLRGDGVDLAVELLREEVEPAADGAAFGEDLRGYLLTVDLENATQGQEITVRFLPPPFPLLAAAAALAVLLAAGWLSAGSIVRRRSVSGA